MAKIFGHFISGSELAYRGYNALVCGGVIYSFCTSPNANALEYLTDAAIHGVEAVFPHTLDKAMLGLNAFRGAQAGIAFFTDIAYFPNFASLTTIPKILNGLDCLPNHLINCVWRLKNIFSEKQSSNDTDVFSTKSKTLLHQATTAPAMAMPGNTAPIVTANDHKVQKKMI